MSRLLSSTAHMQPSARMGLLLTAMLLLVPLTASFFIDHGLRSANENRSLAAWPSPAQAKSARAWVNDAEAFFTDHLAFTLSFNEAYRKFLFFVLRDDPVSNVTVATPELLFLNSHFPESPYQLLENTCANPGGEAAMREMTVVMRCIADSLSAHGQQVTFAFAPSKPAVYPDWLPPKVPPRLRDACRSFPRPGTPAALAGAEYELPVFYPLQRFRELRERPHFYPLQSYHWNGESAFEFTQGLLERLGLAWPADAGITRSLTAQTSDLFMLGFLVYNQVWRYDYPAPPAQRVNADGYVRTRVRMQRLYEHSAPLAERRMLMLSDSFGNNLIEHMTPVFRRFMAVEILHPDVDQAGALLFGLLDSEPWTDITFLLSDSHLSNPARLRPFAQAVGRNWQSFTGQPAAPACAAYSSK